MPSFHLISNTLQGQSECGPAPPPAAAAPGQTGGGGAEPAAAPAAAGELWLAESWSRDPLPTSDWRRAGHVTSAHLWLPQGCTTTGYETNIRQDCTTVTETVCSNVTVAKFNKTIDTKCTTKVEFWYSIFIVLLFRVVQIDQKCKPTKTDVPEQRCAPRYEERCEHLHKTVDKY